MKKMALSTHCSKCGMGVIITGFQNTTHPLSKILANTNAKDVLIDCLSCTEPKDKVGPVIENCYSIVYVCDGEGCECTSSTEQQSYEHTIPPEWSEEVNGDDSVHFCPKCVKKAEEILENIVLRRYGRDFQISFSA